MVPTLSQCEEEPAKYEERAVQTFTEHCVRAESHTHIHIHTYIHTYIHIGVTNYISVISDLSDYEISVFITDSDRTKSVPQGTGNLVKGKSNNFPRDF